MKENNNSNRRFCDVGDVFYDNERESYFFCTNYYKRHNMHYCFNIISNHDLKKAVKDPSYKEKLLNRPYSSRIEMYRSSLDAHWRSGNWTNLDPAQEAKLNLLNIRF